MTDTFSRRRFIHLIGKAGGAAAAYQTMAAMGLLPVPAAYAGPPSLPADSGKGIKVAILGAGIAGMVAAHELGKAGYSCVILEARSRPGGRNWSLRRGDVIEETDTTQTVAWDAGDHLYFNPGPARIPHHHEGILSYCRELDVPIEVMINENRGAYFQDDRAFDGKPQLARSVINDARGFVAELAAKAVDRDLLQGSVSVEDKEKLRAFLRAFGALDKDLVYQNTGRAGFSVPPGVEPGKPSAPLDLRQLLISDFWQGNKMTFGEAFNQGATMLQPIGGMDRIGEAFGKKLGTIIRYDAEVTQIRKTASGARIAWKHRKNGATHVLEAAHVICTIPLPILRNIDADFAPAVKTAIAAVDYVPAAKVAFQAERRFWELDQQIYGGISWTSRDITQIWYPSSALHQAKGIIVGAYIWSHHIGEAFADKSPAQRLKDAIADGERLHPNYGASLVNGVSVAWKKIPFSGSAWAEWSKEARDNFYPVLLKGDGPIFFAGEHMSYITGWQEGAVRSAHHTIEQIAKRVQEKRI